MTVALFPLRSLKGPCVRGFGVADNRKRAEGTAASSLLGTKSRLRMVTPLPHGGRAATQPRSSAPSRCAPASTTT